MTASPHPPRHQQPTLFSSFKTKPPNTDHTQVFCTKFPVKSSKSAGPNPPSAPSWILRGNAGLFPIEQKVGSHSLKRASGAECCTLESARRLESGEGESAWSGRAGREAKQLWDNVDQGAEFSIWAGLRLYIWLGASASGAVGGGGSRFEPCGSSS